MQRAGTLNTAVIIDDKYSISCVAHLRFKLHVTKKKQTKTKPCNL